MRSLIAIVAFSLPVLLVEAEEVARPLRRDRLSESIRDANLPQVRHLVELGVDVNSKDSYGELPLELAVDSCAGEVNIAARKQILSLLIDAGADVNVRLQEWQSPLFFGVCATGRDELVDLFLTQGVDIHAMDRFGQNVLDEMALIGNKRIFARLRKLGLRSPNKLQIVAGLGTPRDVARYFKSGADVNARTKGWENTPLIYAASAQNLANVKELLVRGADPNGTNVHDENALYWCTDRLPIVKALVAAGTDPTHVSARGRAMIDAHWEPAVIKFLQKHGGAFSDEHQELRKPLEVPVLGDLSTPSPSRGGSLGPGTGY